MATGGVLGEAVKPDFQIPTSSRSQLSCQPLRCQTARRFRLLPYPNEQRESMEHIENNTKECYDCRDDTTTDGFTDVIDNAYFCPKCWKERARVLDSLKHT